MENTFNRVHTSCDLTISIIIIIAGIGLFFVNKVLGLFIAAVGLVMLSVFKKGYKFDKCDFVLKKKSLYISRVNRQSILDFIDGRNSAPVLCEGNKGGTVLLDIFYNVKEKTAFVQLFDYNNLSYEPATEVVRLHEAQFDSIAGCLAS